MKNRAGEIRAHATVEKALGLTTFLDLAFAPEKGLHRAASGTARAFPKAAFGTQNTAS